MKGAIAILLTVVILSAILAISLAVAGLMLVELKLSRGVEHSTIAYYAAESGIECELYNLRKASLPCSSMTNGSSFIKCPDAECPGVLPANTIKFLGKYGRTKRSIEASW